ncbi:hypothetical protein DY000_02049569 [Brassica cretica]|uniref:Uncharacterized protein n=1 Tax=Brassica cretica TaxID=69181 RepID=A0ABQ7EXA4_BRACR|nr:hypothetical protein DY000_02049569 [Brassica cretica]
MAIENQDSTIQKIKPNREETCTVAGLTKLHHQDNYFDFQRKLRDQKYSLKREVTVEENFAEIELCLLLFRGAVPRAVLTPTPAPAPNQDLTPALNPPMPSGEKPEKPSGNQ